MNPVISRHELKELIDSGSTPTLVEALPRAYYEAEHLPGAIHIPHDEVEARAARLIPDKGRPVVVYCANAACRNSRIAAQALRKLGYSRVYEYTEGKQGWKDAGLPLETGGGGAT
jgi:rhodanese-related sulfurtransferase